MLTVYYNERLLGIAYFYYIFHNKTKELNFNLKNELRIFNF